MVALVASLHAAAAAGHREVCMCLLQAGALTNTRDSRGRTADAWAARRGHAELAQLIRAAGPTPARPGGWCFCTRSAKVDVAP